MKFAACYKALRIFHKLCCAFVKSPKFCPFISLVYNHRVLARLKSFNRKRFTGSRIITSGQKYTCSFTERNNSLVSVVKSNTMPVYVVRGTEFPSTLVSAFNWDKWSVFCVFGPEVGEIFLHT